MCLYVGVDSVGNGWNMTKLGLQQGSIHLYLRGPCLLKALDPTKPPHLCLCVCVCVCVCVYYKAMHVGSALILVLNILFRTEEKLNLQI